MLDKTTVLKRLGKRIKLARIQANLTQAQLAAILHLNISSIRAYERGNVDIPICTFKNIADILHIRVEFLLDFSNDMDLDIAK